MSNALIAFLLAIGSATWIYSKAYNRTGGNTSSSLVIAGSMGALIFLASLIILSFIV